MQFLTAATISRGLLWLQRNSLYLRLTLLTRITSSPPPLLVLALFRLTLFLRQKGLGFHFKKAYLVIIVRLLLSSAVTVAPTASGTVATVGAVAVVATTVIIAIATTVITTIAIAITIATTIIITITVTAAAASSLILPGK